MRTLSSIVGVTLADILRTSVTEKDVVAKIEKRMIRWVEHVEDRLRKIDETDS